MNVGMEATPMSAGSGAYMKALSCFQVRTPQKSGLEALWARAGQAGHLRLEVESARVNEQERSLAEARQHLEQWDYLVVHP